MSTRFIHILLCLLVACSLQARSFVLVIDAGHGGKDPGAIGRTAKEKNINLSVALAFGRLVEANCPDVKVVYTRKTDVFVTLDGRADIANKAKADLFVSIHTNAMPKGHSHMKGTETYTLGMHRADENLEVAKRENSAILVESDYKTRYQGFNPNSSESYIMFEFMQDRNMQQSVNFARHMQREFRAAGRHDKGVHQAGFLVLRATSMPSALIEMGYISSPAEEQFLASKEGQEKLGRAIYNAFRAYRGKKAAATQQQPTPEPPKKEEADSSNGTPAPAEPAPARNNEADAAPVTFRVQFMVSERIVKTVKGISTFEYYKEGKLYKYTTGRYATFAEAQHHRNQLAKQYNGAFVVAFQGDERIDVQEAKKMVKQK